MGSRLHARDTKIRRPHSNVLPGFVQIVCKACESVIAYEVTKRPEKCRMCGADLPPTETVGMRDFAIDRRGKNSPERITARVAGIMKKAIEHRDKRELGGSQRGEQPDQRRPRH